MYLMHIKPLIPLYGNDIPSEQLVPSFVQWLQLTVGHIDAVERLILYINSNAFQYTKIQFKILRPPAIEKRWAPWHETLETYLRKRVVRKDSPTRNCLNTYKMVRMQAPPIQLREPSLRRSWTL